MEACKTLEEVRRIKEERSLHYLSLSPEAREREMKEVMKRAEEAMGKRLTFANIPIQREASIEELAHV